MRLPHLSLGFSTALFVPQHMFIDAVQIGSAPVRLVRMMNKVLLI
jgi:hypothetical protein